MRRLSATALVLLGVTAAPAAAQLPDLTPPVIVCGASDGFWHPSNVSISCTASDPDSGVPNAADQVFNLTTAVLADSETNNAATGTRLVCNGYLIPLCSTAGPINGNMVDLKAPDNPLTIASSDHVVGTWSRDRTITMTFTAGDDGGSGVDGFSYIFSSSPGTSPDAMKDGEETLRDATSGLLTSGVWYFHLATMDNVGNWSVATHSGPYLVDIAKPVVLALPRVGRAGQIVPLRYRTADNSGKTRERVTLRRGGVLLRAWTRPVAGAPWGMIQRVLWRPRAAGRYSLCVNATDPAGNGRRSCAPITVGPPAG
jgi:hypothetical protein